MKQGIMENVDPVQDEPQEIVLQIGETKEIEGMSQITVLSGTLKFVSPLGNVLVRLAKDGDILTISPVLTVSTESGCKFILQRPSRPRKVH